MGPSSLDGSLPVFFLPQSEFDIFIYLVTVDRLILPTEISCLSNQIEQFSSCGTEPKVNCLLDFIPLSFHGYWLTVVSMRECMVVIRAVGLS